MKSAANRKINRGLLCYCVMFLSLLRLIFQKTNKGSVKKPRINHQENNSPRSMQLLQKLDIPVYCTVGPYSRTVVVVVYKYVRKKVPGTR